MKRKHINTLFIALTIILTLLSLQAQFSFWSKLFGEVIGYTASAVFEILRLASLFALIFRRPRKEGRKKDRFVFTYSVAIYLGIALFCGSIAITSWHGEIIESSKSINVTRNEQLSQKLFQVKSAYAKEKNNEMKKLERKIEYQIDPEVALAISKLESNPDSKEWNEKLIAWEERKKQIYEEIKQKEKEKNTVLSANPSDKENWLERYSADVGVNIHLEKIEETEFSSLEEAIYNMWGLQPNQAKKMASIIFVGAIEIGIILLAVLTESKSMKKRKYTKRKKKINYTSKKEEKAEKVLPKRKKNLTLITALEKRFKKKNIEKFTKQCFKEYTNKNSLPKEENLTESSKEIRKYLINSDSYTMKNINELSKYYLGKDIWKK